MNAINKTPHTFVGGLLSIADESEPLAEEKNPALAAAIAFVTGGIGLGLYLRSWRDFFIPFGLLLMVLILGIVTFEVLSVATPFIWSAYAYRRVKASNEKLLAGRSGIIEAEIIAPRSTPFATKQPPNLSPVSLPARLQRLDDLLRQGILTPSEHAQKRAEIIQEL